MSPDGIRSQTGSVNRNGDVMVFTGLFEVVVRLAPVRWRANRRCHVAEVFLSYCSAALKLPPMNGTENGPARGVLKQGKIDALKIMKVSKGGEYDGFTSTVL